MHAPVEQDSHFPSHRLLQHAPSVQYPVEHSASLAQAPVAFFGTQDVPLQYVPAAQDVGVQAVVAPPVALAPPVLVTPPVLTGPSVEAVLLAAAPPVATGTVEASTAVVVPPEAVLPPPPVAPPGAPPPPLPLDTPAPPVEVTGRSAVVPAGESVGADQVSATAPMVSARFPSELDPSPCCTLASFCFRSWKQAAKPTTQVRSALCRTMAKPCRMRMTQNLPPKANTASPGAHRGSNARPSDFVSLLSWPTNHHTIPVAKAAPPAA